MLKLPSKKASNTGDEFFSLGVEHITSTSNLIFKYSGSTYLHKVALKSHSAFRSSSGCKCSFNPYYCSIVSPLSLGMLDLFMGNDCGGTIFKVLVGGDCFSTGTGSYCCHGAYIVSHCT